MQATKEINEILGIGESLAISFCEQGLPWSPGYPPAGRGSGRHEALSPNRYDIDIDCRGKCTVTMSAFEAINSSWHKRPQAA